MCRMARGSSEPATAQVVSLAIALHPGFLILDSLHFQYNGFLFGLMLLSLAGAKEVGLGVHPRAVVSLHRRQRKPLACAAYFAALLNFKYAFAS